MSRKKAREMIRPEAMDQPRIKTLASAILKNGMREKVFKCLYMHGEQAVKRIRERIDTNRDQVSTVLKWFSEEELVESRPAKPYEIKKGHLPRTAFIWKLTRSGSALVEQVYHSTEKRLHTKRSRPTNVEKRDLRSMVHQIIAQCSSKVLGEKSISVLRTSLREGPCELAKLANRLSLRTHSIEKAVEALTKLGAFTTKIVGDALFVELTRLGQSAIWFINEHPNTHFRELLKAFDDEQQAS